MIDWFSLSIAFITTHATPSGMLAQFSSSGGDWIVDSGTLKHMSGTK